MNRIFKKAENVLIFDRVAIHTLTAAMVVIFLCVGIFNIDDAWAEEQTVTMNCPEEKTKKVKLKPNVDYVSFEVAGCLCKQFPDGVKKAVMLNVRTLEAAPGFTIEPGESKTMTLYCYSDQQWKEIMQSNN